HIQGLEDLTRPDVTYVNRQRGSGTRVLLDYQLSQAGISPDGIQGYRQEEFTHLAVAAAVQSGRADCGLGITASARALDLDFLPLYTEIYQLIVAGPVLETGLLDPLFELAADPAFRQAVLALPGYDVSRMGQKVVEIQ
ncbi:MAG TPA: substrate-binding domain-containing protein, partial [Anaerolineaceae bacterium]|nr:substrate-binding domain-containing protein [Anaerolineaceae bacterium]